MVPVEVFLKTVVRGAAPEVGVALKLAMGAAAETVI